MREFKIGFTGAALTESIEWIYDRTRDRRHVCIPFAGSCKITAALAEPGRVIESWDTQIISRAIVEGVFQADKIERTIDKPRYKKGYMYDKRALNKIDDRCAGLIDYVGAHGTLAEKVAIFSATVRSTSMGRMTDWNSDINRFWVKFEKNLEYLERFTSLPGTFIHHEEDVFIEVPQGPYDFMHVDPPKVVSTSDIYSQNYLHLNRALGGKCEVPKWTWRDTPGYLRKIFQLDARRTSFIYVSDIKPTLADMRKILEEYSVVVDDVRLLHRSRYDYILLAERKAV
jgi:hypothetical protein